jgi:hypothetical protein
MKTSTQNLTILHDSQEWSTEIEGEIGEIRVDGKRLNDVHDLATKIDKITTVIKALALTATFLAIVAVAGVSGIGSWIVAHHDQINTTLDASQEELNRLSYSNLLMGQKLKSLGWEWKDGGWQQIGNSPVNPSK